MSLELPQAQRLRLRLWLEMLKATRHIEAELREKLRLEHGTTLPRFDVMAALERRPDGLKMSELSRRLMVSNGNVTGIVDRLVEDGLVVRVDVEGDRRATRVRLTSKGRHAFEAMAVEHARWIQQFTDRLDEREIADTTAVLEKIRKVEA
ncbi:MarR family winged helix-turn-helix transcriptional regulator [Algihabitans albus]|uniref:MarR family winged helix-turn-helix transcriptional regulator n=1 Tax=Algihabitans albus TaxID=2164067 RepID=UPI000E5D8451|nr:MarR family transcriptional regulator [Algihabitans albus]